MRVDQRADNANHTIPPVVRIEISLPGHKDIVVAHEPDHLQRKFQAPDLHERHQRSVPHRRSASSRSYKEQLTDRTAAGVRMKPRTKCCGQVAEITPAEDFGFLLTASGGLLYFHRNSMLSGDFDRLEGRRRGALRGRGLATPVRPPPRCGSKQNGR